MKFNAGAFFATPAGQWSLLIGVGGLIFWLVHDKIKQDIKDTAGAIGDGAVAITEGVGGLITGRNVITESARTDAYVGAGIAGTLGAGADAASGGALSTLGEWFGGQLADFRDYFNRDENPSSAIQSSSNKPYSKGPNMEYADAVDRSPVQASYTASPWAISP